MFIKLSFIFLFSCISFLNGAERPERLGLQVGLNPNASIRCLEYFNYCEIKEIFDSHLNKQLFAAKTGFFGKCDGASIYTPVDYLSQQLKDKFRCELGCLFECNCSLFGRQKSYARIKLEEAMVSTFRSYQKDRSEPFYYTSIGSGGLFQDLLLITKLLESGFRRIVVNLIDEDYRDFVADAAAFCRRSEVRLVTCCHAADGEPLNFESALYQFLKWFKFLCECAYPDMQISVLVYSELDHYLGDCRNGNNHKSDVATIIDFDGMLGADDSIKSPRAFIEYKSPFYRKIYDEVLTVGGIYAYAIVIEGDCYYLENIKAGLVWSDYLLTELQRYKEVACFCGIK